MIGLLILLAVIVFSAFSWWFGYHIGWTDADRYWKSRLSERPSSIDVIADLEREVARLKKSSSSSVGFENAVLSKPNTPSSTVVDT